MVVQERLVVVLVVVCGVSVCMCVLGGGVFSVSTWSLVINKSVISANIGLSNGCGRLGPLPWLLTESLILPDLRQDRENKAAFERSSGA